MEQIKAHETIRQLRLKKGLSQKDLAEKIGTSQQAIALLENGKRKLEFDLFIEILNKIGITNAELQNIIHTIFSQPAETIQLAEEAEKIISELEADKTSMLDIEILQNFQKLNDLGKIEAAKRVEELTQLPRYTQKEE